MNHTMHTYGRFCRKRWMNLLVIVPLLLAAMFAYQAGNTFEQSAGTSRIHAGATRASYTNVVRENTNTKFFLPAIVFINAFKHALILMHSLPSAIYPALRTSVPQRLRDLFMIPIKFTSRFVG